MSPAAVQRLMRHATLAQTEGYTHVAGDDLRAAIEAGAQRLEATRKPQSDTAEPQNVPA